MPTESNWEESISIAGEQIAMRLNDSNGKHAINSNATNEISTTGEAVRNRRFGIPKLAASETSPSVLRRNQLQSSLLVELAQRSELDHWYDDHHKDPYYVRAARSYLNQASRLFEKNVQFTDLEHRLASEGEFELVAPSTISLTTESQIPFEFGIRRSKQNKVREGFPMLWVRSEGSIELSRKAVQLRMPQALVAEKDASMESCELLNPMAKETNRIESKTKASQVSTRTSSPNVSLTPARNVSDVRGKTPKAKQKPAAPGVSIYGFFRGNQLNKQVNVSLHPQPVVSAGQFEEPQDARLSVRADSELHGLYGSGSGAISIVLDASGSMGAKRGQSFDQSAKYYEATRALKTVLSQMPDGVSLSVWIFGQATGPDKTVRHAEQTIQRVIEPTVWNKQDSGAIESIMKTIEYPNIEPWNESPIVQTILAARQDVLGHEGFKTVLVVTDGMDNRFESFGNQNASGQSTTVKTALKTAFDRSGITLNVVGFRVEAREEMAARNQFEIAETFTPPGKYVEAKNAQELAATLKSLLHQRVHYWIDSYANESLTRMRIKMEAGEGNSGTSTSATTHAVATDKWYPAKLSPGNYMLWNSADTNPTQLTLLPGDRMIVQLGRKGEDIRCDRLPWLSTDYGWKPGKTAAGWMATALENRMAAPKQFEFLLGMENIPTGSPSTIQQLCPYDIWIELTDRSGKSISSPVVWNRTTGYPVPTWRIQSDDWPHDEHQKPIVPVVNIWFAPERLAAAAARLERGRDFATLNELAGHSVDVNGSTVLIESAEIEKRSVETSPNHFEEQSCLVVRMNHEVGKDFWVRPRGMEFDGQRKMFFDEIGKQTGVFWPATQHQVKSMISALEIVSRDEMKRDAESNGYTIRLDNLSTPAAEDVTFPPLVGEQ